MRCMGVVVVWSGRVVACDGMLDVLCGVVVIIMCPFVLLSSPYVLYVCCTVDTLVEYVDLLDATGAEI